MGSPTIRLSLLLGHKVIIHNPQIGSLQVDHLTLEPNFYPTPVFPTLSLGKRSESKQVYSTYHKAQNESMLWPDSFVYGRYSTP
jgi:hypothetical protein